MKTHYAVTLSQDTARQVERYSWSAGLSISGAIVTLVEIGLKTARTVQGVLFNQLATNFDNEDPI